MSVTSKNTLELFMDGITSSILSSSVSAFQKAYILDKSDKPNAFTHTNSMIYFQDTEKKKIYLEKMSNAMIIRLDTGDYSECDRVVTEALGIPPKSIEYLTKYRKYSETPEHLRDRVVVNFCGLIFKTAKIHLLEDANWVLSHYTFPESYMDKVVSFKYIYSGPFESEDSQTIKKTLREIIEGGIL